MEASCLQRHASETKPVCACRLVKHNYPPGPIHLTRTHLPTLPIYYSVGNFKVEYMEGLKNKGLELFAAYGSAFSSFKASQSGPLMRNTLMKC